MKLPLRYYGDPVLWQKAEKIGEITDEIRTLAADMIETMLEAKGIGLAAPQVGVSKCLFISNVEGEDEEGNVLIGEPRVYINPIIANPSETIAEREEGCLSIPGLYVPVVRPLSITIEALDLDGKPFKREAYGFLARNLLHEFDHLNGVLTVDRLKGKRRTQVEPDLRKIRQKYSKKK